MYTALNHWGIPNRLKLSEQINALKLGVTIFDAQNINSLTLNKSVWVCYCVRDKQVQSTTKK